MNTEANKYLYKRDPSLNFSGEEITCYTKSGVPYLAPHIQLLYKSKSLRPKDQEDFNRCLKRLSREQRNWLKNKLNQFFDEKLDYDPVDKIRESKLTIAKMCTGPFRNLVHLIDRCKRFFEHFELEVKNKKNVPVYFWYPLKNLAKNSNGLNAKTLVQDYYFYAYSAKFEKTNWHKNRYTKGTYRKLIETLDELIKEKKRYLKL